MLTSSILLTLASGFLPAPAPSSTLGLAPVPLSSAALAEPQQSTSLQNTSLAAQLPAEARYVAHLDVRALLGSRLWKDLGSEALQGDALDNLKELKRELGVDILEDVHSLTVYSSSPDEKSMAIMVRGTRSLDQALSRLDGMDENMSLEVEGLTLHILGRGDDDSTYAYSHDAGRSDESLIVLSPSRTELLRSALVLRGGRRSLSALGAQDDETRLPHLNMEANTILHVAFAGSIPGSDDDGDPISRIINLAQGGVLSIGEFRDNLSIRMGITTTSEDQALEMADAVDGLTALAGLLLKSSDNVPQGARQLLRSFRVNSDGSTVYVDLTYPLDKLLEMAKGMEFGN